MLAAPERRFPSGLPVILETNLWDKSRERSTKIWMEFEEKARLGIISVIGGRDAHFGDRYKRQLGNSLKPRSGWYEDSQWSRGMRIQRRRYRRSHKGHTNFQRWQG